MAKITFPADGGTICLDVVLRQSYQCTDGSSGTTVCSVYGDQYNKCSDVVVTSKFYPYGDISSDLVYMDDDGCLHCTYTNGNDEEVDIGEFCLETTVNGKTTEECVEISVEPHSEPECNYGEVSVMLSFPKMTAEGGYSSRVCATYSFMQTNICDGVEEVITSCDGGVCEEWGYTDPYGKEETSLTYEDGTVCLVGPANTSEEERVVSRVELTVTLNDMTGIASFDVIQAGVEPTPEPEPEPTTTYSIPEVYIEYPTVFYNGTSHMLENDRLPVYSYVQYKYEDDVVVETITDGGMLLFASEDDRINVSRADGMITVNETNTDEMPRELGPITLSVTLNGQTGVGECYVTQEEADEYKLGYHLRADWTYGGGIAGAVNGTVYEIQPCSYFRYYLIEERDGVRQTEIISEGYDVKTFIECGGQIAYTVSNLHDSIVCQVDGQEIGPLPDSVRNGGVSVLADESNENCGIVNLYTHNSSSDYKGEITITILDTAKLEELYGQNQITLCSVDVYLSIGELGRVYVDGESLMATWW
ncbi:MAG: hypothetical protein LUD72_10210 [Bacteroidales bacterium]|nr:hypothetical protein [Bacteroidales bacterium]